MCDNATTLIRDLILDSQSYFRSSYLILSDDLPAIGDPLWIHGESNCKYDSHSESDSESGLINWPDLIELNSAGQ